MLWWNAEERIHKLTLPILNLSKLTPCLKDTFFERRLIVPRKLLFLVQFGPLRALLYFITTLPNTI